MFTRLLGDRRQAWNGGTIPGIYGCRVTDGIDFRLARYAKVGFRNNTPCPIRFSDQPSGRRGCSHTCSPKHRLRGDASVAYLDTLAIHIDNALPRTHVDAQPAQITLGVLRQHSGYVDEGPGPGQVATYSTVRFRVPRRTRGTP